MSVPTTATYDAGAKIAAHTAFRDLIDTGSGAGSVVIRDASDVLLAEIALTDPCGTVNGTTGQLTLTPDGREESAPAGGVAAYAEIRSVDDTPRLSLPCQAGTSAVSGKCVMSTLTVTLGEPVEIVSIVIG